MLGQKLPLPSQPGDYSTSALGKQYPIPSVGVRQLADIDEPQLWAIVNSADVEASLRLAVEAELEKREARWVRWLLS